jgi:hypothetical protein
MNERNQKSLITTFFVFMCAENDFKQLQVLSDIVSEYIQR